MHHNPEGLEMNSASTGFSVETILMDRRQKSNNVITRHSECCVCQRSLPDKRLFFHMLHPNPR